MLNKRNFSKLDGHFDGKTFIIKGKKVATIDEIKLKIVEKLFEKSRKSFRGMTSIG